MKKLFLTVVALAALAVVVPQADAHVRRQHHRHYASGARVYVTTPVYGRYARSYYPYYGGYSSYYGNSYGAYGSPYYGGFYGGFPSIGFVFGGGHHHGGHHGGHH